MQLFPLRKCTPHDLAIGNGNRPIEDITSPSRTRLRSIKHNNRCSDDPGNDAYDRGSGKSDSHESRYLQPGPRRQVGGDTRGWTQHRHHQQPQLLERKCLREQPSENRAWPASQDDGRGLYGGGKQQHSQHPPVPEIHYAAYGGYSTHQHAGGGEDELRYPLEGERGAEWPGEGSTSDLPPPRRTHTNNTRDGGGDGGHGYGEENREDWRLAGPTPENGGNAVRQEHRTPTKPSGGGVVDGAWREGGGGDYTSRNHFDQQAERRGQQEYRNSGPGPPPSDVPVAAVGVGVGVGVVSTKASTMHNPVDPEELAKIQAKKDSYRRDLEAQVTERERGGVRVRRRP